MADTPKPLANVCRYQLEILEVNKNGVNGHIAVKCRTIDTGDNVHGVGAIEYIAIDPLELQARYHGDAVTWLEHAGREIIHRHRQRTVIHSDLNSLRGQRINIPVPGDIS